MAYMAEWEPLHSMARRVHHWQPGDPGRPPDVPPAAAILFGVMALAMGSERKVERMLRHPATWEPVRVALESRYSLFRGLRPSAPPMTRSEFRRYRDGYGLGAAIPEFRAVFRVEMTQLAQDMGMFDQSAGSHTHPAPQNMLVGDGTVMRPRFDAAPGDMQLDAVTGAIEQKPFDPDAGWYMTGDKRRVYGTKFGFIEGWTPHDGERVILDVFDVETVPGGDEASRALESIEHLAAKLPGAQGVVWDMALRGKHVDRLYQIGLLSVVKVARVKGGPKSPNIGQYEARCADRATRIVSVFAIAGAPHIMEIAAGQEHPILLQRREIRARKNQDGSWRWYGEFRVPDAPAVRGALRGAAITIRLHTNDEDDVKGLNRAEVLRPIPEGDPDWRKLYGLRPGAESINRWFKERLRDGRAPAVGRERQHFALLCGAIYNNFKALLARQDRLGLPLPGAPPPASAAA